VAAVDAFAGEVGQNPDRGGFQEHREEGQGEYRRRELTFVTVNRTGPRLHEPYGHWWVEVGRKESYGWWPDRPWRLRQWFTGTGGCLNGTWFNTYAFPTRDGLHPVPADHRFHPVLVADTADIRAFAAAYAGD